MYNSDEVIMIFLASIFAAIIIFFSYLHWVQTRSHAAKLINKFPLIAPITPILGHVQLLSTDPEILFNQIRYFANKFSETYAGWGGIYPTLQIITADDAEIILSNVNLIEKGTIYSTIEPWLNDGLLTSTGIKWHSRRKMLTPAFHYKILKIYVDIFGEQCDRLIKKLKEEYRGEATNIVPIMTDCTLEIICETAMGLKLDKNDQDQINYFKALHSLAPILIRIILSPWLHPNFKVYYFSKLHWQRKKLVQKLQSFTRRVIKKRQEKFEDDDTNFELTDTKSKRSLAMLDLLIHVKRQLGEIDDEGIREEVDTFVFEGHDTTSVASCYALLLLANHADIQERVIEELDEIFKGTSRHATYEDLQNMKYLDRVIKECLRIYPSVPFISRRIKEDTPLTHHVAPAGTEIFIHIYNIHRDPKYYPDPEKFDPDRFLPENSKGRHPYAYIPFSAGPRNCIGQKFAMMELKSIVSSILRNFTIEPIDEPENLSLIVDFVLRVKGPIRVSFKSRFNAPSNC